jgi:hypothetical protein
MNISPLLHLHEASQTFMVFFLPLSHMLLRVLMISLAVAALFTSPSIAEQSISVPIGDTLPLSGSAPGADTIFLYLTGPNLPPNGVKLDDIAVPVVTGVPSTFVQTPVSADGTWEYSWSTRTQGGILDAGVYVIYAVSSPTGRLDLTGRNSYAAITVELTPPTLTAGFGGGLTITSQPSNAGVLVDGIPQGATPLELTNVSAGEHTVEITKLGYMPVIVNTTVQEGENSTVNETLIPASTQVPPASGTTTMPTSVPASVPQTTSMPFPVLALLLALVMGRLMGKEPGK